MNYNAPIELYKVIEEVVDSMRKVGSITASTEDVGTYTITSPNEFSNYEYATIDDVSYQLTNVTDTEFTIKGDEGIDFVGLEWKANAPYYMHEKESVAGKILTEKTGKDNLKYQKYPLILLIHSYTDTRTNSVTGYNITPTIHILTNTEQEYWSDDRYTNNFEPTLLPLYYDFLDALAVNDNIRENYPQYIEHTKTDLLFIDGNPFPDKMDGLTIEPDITVLVNTICEPTTQVIKRPLTISIDGDGEIYPTAGTYQIKNGTEVNLIAAENIGNEFVGWDFGETQSTERNQSFIMTGLVNAVARFRSVLQVIQNVFSTVITENAIYVDQSGNNNDVTAIGSNHVTYDSVLKQHTEFNSVSIDNGDNIYFWAKQLDTTKEGAILGTNTNYQVKFSANANSIVIYLSNSIMTISTGVVQTDWNKYGIRIDKVNNRIGLFVNNSFKTWTYTSGYPSVSLKYLARIGSVTYGNVAISDLLWLDENGDSKIHYPLAEGFGMPFDVTQQGLMSYRHSGEYGNDDTLPSINALKGFGYKTLNINVVLFLGQSNCSGQVVTNSDYEIPQNHFYGYVSAGYEEPLNRLEPQIATNKGGVELSAGVQLTASGEKVLIIKAGLDGTNLYSNWQKGGSSYDAFLQLFNKTKSQLSGYTFNIREVIWIQGESDATDQTNAENYQDNFNQMWSDFLSDGLIDADTIPIIPKLSNTPYTYESTVNTAYQDIVSAKNGRLIETSDLIKKSDNIHYPEDSLVTLGERLIAGYIAAGYTVSDTEYKQLVPIVDASNLDANGNNLYYTIGDGFPNADSKIIGIMYADWELKKKSFAEIYDEENILLEKTQSDNTILQLLVKEEL